MLGVEVLRSGKGFGVEVSLGWRLSDSEMFISCDEISCRSSEDFRRRGAAGVSFPMRSLVTGADVVR